MAIDAVETQFPQGSEQLVNWFRLPDHVHNKIHRLLLDHDTTGEKERKRWNVRAQFL